MTNMVDGTQYIIQAAGGHAQLGTTLGDSVVAYALPEQGRRGR
jgi:quinoprotein glucose dehydrogenase